MSTERVRAAFNNVIQSWKRLGSKLRRLEAALNDADVDEDSPEGEVVAKQLKQLKTIRAVCDGQPAAGSLMSQIEFLGFARDNLVRAPVNDRVRILEAVNILRGNVRLGPTSTPNSVPPFGFTLTVSAPLTEDPTFSVEHAIIGFDAARKSTVDGVNGKEGDASNPLRLYEFSQTTRRLVGTLSVANPLFTSWFDAPAYVPNDDGDPIPKGGFNWPDDGDLDVVAEAELGDAKEALEDLVEQITTELDSLVDRLRNEQAGDIGRISAGLEDLGAYPLLTSERPTSGWAGGGGGGQVQPGPASLGRVVEGALRGVLGRSPRVNDTRAFSTALRQTFSVVAVQGRTEVRFQPRTFAGQADLGGGVTGAQASLYSRASTALDKALPLLEGLEPLDPAADEELVDANRAIVRQELIELVQSLRVEGGPTKARVDRVVASLFGDKATKADEVVVGTKPGGHFKALAKALGIARKNVNTLEEESTFSNYLAVFDFANQIRIGWIDFREKFQGKDLGTRLVQLSRALSVTAETVDEIYAAMDSVFVGPAERQVASFFSQSENAPVLIGELLQWVVDFTTEEAPRLVQDGGLGGVSAIEPTAAKLENLVEELIIAIDFSKDIAQGLKHPRVRFPLRELRTYLGDIQRIADDVALIDIDVSDDQQRPPNG